MTEETTTGAQESQQTDGTATEQSNSSAETTTQSGVAETGSTEGGTIATGGAETTTDTGAATDDKGDLQRFREQLAGGDAGLLKTLERYKSINAISGAFKEARTAAKGAGKPLSLSEKATEDEVKAYRDAMGIPAEAKDYPVAFRDDFKASEADAAILDSFKAYLHQGNADPRAAKVALDWYQDFAANQAQEMNTNLAKVAKETQTSLRSEWGGEYDGNISAAAQLMTAQLGEEGFNQMMDLRLMDGSRLQDNAAFVKMMAQVGSDYYGGNAIMTGDVETTAKTVQERIDETLAMRNTDPNKYFSDEVQGKLTALYAQRDKINARKK